MAKIICVSLSNWVFEQYLSEIKNNRSKFIEEMIVKGIQQELGEGEISKSKSYSMLQELRNKDEEIKKLTLQLGNIKKRFGTEASQERIELERLADGIRANNPLRDE
jgi:hypothetical protein